MRINILFTCEKLPILYRHRIMAMIKEALRLSDKSYKDSLYPDKNSVISKIVKPFSFSLLLPKSKEIKKEKITVDADLDVEDVVFYFPNDNTVSLLVSSYDNLFTMLLYNGLLAMKEFDFGNGITLTLKKVFLLNEKQINNSEAIFKTISPILIEDKNEKPLLPDNNLLEFNNELNIIHDKILNDIRGRGLKTSLEFTPITCKKQVVKHTLEGFRKKTGKPYMTLTCYEGQFKLKGEPEDLQTLYQVGIGLRTGQGFGMIEVI